MTQIPGSSSGNTLGLSIAKAGLRLVGGSDLADTIADLTGLSARRVKSLARDGTRRLQQSGQIEHEYREVKPDSYSAMESAVVSAFRRAVERDPQVVPVAALTGIDDLLDAVTDSVWSNEMRQWSQDEAAYAIALMRQVAQLCREWYLENGTARGFAAAAGVGQLLKGQGEMLSGQHETLSILRQQIGVSRPAQLDAAVETLERRLAEVGWEWTTVRAGAVSGLDGFMTPTDETGAFLPIQIPVRLLRGNTLEGKRGELLGPHASREDVALLRAHVPSGYFMVYSEQNDSLHFAAAAEVADLFARGVKSRDRVRVKRSDIVTELTLGTIGRSAWAERKRLVEALGAPTLREPAIRLYQTLSSAHHVFFEFLAALAFVDPGNLLFVHHQWARGLAEEGRNEDDYLEAIVSTIDEYEVAPPIGLLHNFPAASFMLTVMRTVIDQLDEIGPSLGAGHHGVADQLGVPGLRTTISAAIERSYRTSDGEPLSVNTPDHKDASWVVVNTGHYFMSVALVGLVVDRLVHSVRGVVLPPVEGSEKVTLAPAWIRYRPNPRTS